MKILHIEDNKMVIDVVKEMLKGNEFKSCESLDDVKVKDLKWADLIFLDLILDASSVELKGLKVLDLMKKNGMKKKVVILSALPEEAKKAKFKYNDLVIGIIGKPFLKNDLDKYVKKAKK
ncbi:MAG: response regulator [Candidatus Nanoarchaeia archaeon]|nr:response regulator [Candidatus Nanoarchaeia archaeon]